MAKKQELTWHKIDPSIFPANVQSAIKAVHAAQKAHNESATAKALQVAIANADKLVQPLASRIAVEGVAVLREGDTLRVAFKWGGFAVASAKPQSGMSGGKAAALLA
jgi:hypothetical protein